MQKKNQFGVYLFGGITVIMLSTAALLLLIQSKWITIPTLFLGSALTVFVMTWREEKWDEEFLFSIFTNKHKEGTRDVLFLIVLLITQVGLVSFFVFMIAVNNTEPFCLCSNSDEFNNWLNATGITGIQSMLEIMSIYGIYLQYLRLFGKFSHEQ